MYQSLYIYISLKRFINNMVGDTWSVRVSWVGVWIVGVMIGMGLADKVQSEIVIITPENID